MPCCSALTDGYLNSGVGSDLKKKTALCIHAQLLRTVLNLHININEPRYHHLFLHLGCVSASCPFASTNTLDGKVTVHAQLAVTFTIMIADDS